MSSEANLQSSLQEYKREMDDIKYKIMQEVMEGNFDGDMSSWIDKTYHILKKHEQYQYNQAKYRQKKDEILAHHKLYREANKDKIKTRTKQWNQEHKTEVSEKKKVYYEKNKEKILARQRAWYDKNKRKKDVIQMEQPEPLRFS